MMNKRAVKSSELIRLKIIKKLNIDTLCVIFKCKITCVNDGFFDDFIKKRIWNRKWEASNKKTDLITNAKEELGKSLLIKPFFV